MLDLYDMTELIYLTAVIILEDFLDIFWPHSCKLGSSICLMFVGSFALCLISMYRYISYTSHSCV